MTTDTGPSGRAAGCRRSKRRTGVDRIPGVRPGPGGDGGPPVPTPAGYEGLDRP
ncbi:hypothetical protein AB0E08_39800 [Streptomyces sp. NPDC048281]|uniref:hypothetical protein n=1 Tax=Streptomyces sp. NPDC048281 TaxID=3154715 RepID=UPI003441E3F7